MNLKRAFIALAVVLVSCGEGGAARNSEIAQRMLTERGAPDFADASNAERPAIRHTPSGMVCVMPAEGTFEFDLFPADSINRGAHCSTMVGEVMNAWVAVSFREPTTLDAAFANAVAEISGERGGQPWDGQPSEADRSSPEGLPHYRIHRVSTDYGDGNRYLRLAMSEMDGWYVQQIVSAPLADAETAERQAGEEWRAVLRDFAAERAAARGQ